MILDVSGQAIDLVDDHGADVAFGDALEHGLEVGAVGRARRLARVDELISHVAAFLGAGPQARFSLRGDRVTLLGVTLLRLLFGRDPQVDESVHAVFSSSSGCCASVSWIASSMSARANGRNPEPRLEPATDISSGRSASCEESAAREAGGIS